MAAYHFFALSYLYYFVKKVPLLLGIFGRISVGFFLVWTTELKFSGLDQNYALPMDHSVPGRLVIEIKLFYCWGLT